MPLPSWNATLHDRDGCAIFDNAGHVVRRLLDQEQVVTLLVACLQTLHANKILVRPTHPIVVTRAPELDVGAEVELDEPEPEPTEDG